MTDDLTPATSDPSGPQGSEAKDRPARLSADAIADALERYHHTPEQATEPDGLRGDARVVEGIQHRHELRSLAAQHGSGSGRLARTQRTAPFGHPLRDGACLVRLRQVAGGGQGAGACVGAGAQRRHGHARGPVQRRGGDVGRVEDGGVVAPRRRERGDGREVGSR